MKKIRVIHCLGQLNTGGAETLVMNVFRNIDRGKIQFDFLLFNKMEGVFDKEVKKLGANIYYTESMRSVGITHYVKKMIKFFEEEKPDVVHSHMDWQGGFIACAAHKAGVKKIVVHSHANQALFESNLIYKWLIRWNKYLIKKYATAFCACSQEAGKSLFGNENFEVVVNGIDMKRYLNPNLEIVAELKNKFDIKETDIVLGHIGSFSENKNQEFLIELVQELVKKNSHYKLLLVGDGALKSKLEKKVKKLDLEKHVMFLGVRLEIPEILQLLDVFLFPSKSEGLGIVAVEAQASKCQCILSTTIPREVDLSLGLVEYVLVSEKRKWIESIEKKVEEKIIVNNSEIINSRFNLKNTIKQLMEIYG